jgi:hypothetical protein
MNKIQSLRFSHTIGIQWLYWKGEYLSKWHKQLSIHRDCLKVKTASNIRLTSNANDSRKKAIFSPSKRSAVLD